MLELEEINVFYGHVHALKGVSIQVEQGELVTILGANGAGKTTALMTLSGILKPRSGRITYL
jgi:branched-chain amino acid transport system ATP-binding protein